MEQKISASNTTGVQESSADFTLQSDILGDTSALQTMLEKTTKACIASEQTLKMSPPEPLPLDDAVQKSIRPLNKITSAVASDIAEIAWTANTIVDAILNNHAVQHGIAVDQKTLDFFLVLKEFTNNPLPKGTKDIDALWTRLHKLSTLAVPLPDEPWAESVQAFADYTKYQLIAAIASNEHIECLNDIVTKLFDVSEEDFLDIAENHLRFAWHSNDFMGDSDTAVQAKELLSQKLGEIFLRNTDAQQAEKSAAPKLPKVALIDSIATRHLRNLTGLCMESPISMPDLFDAVQSACAHLNILLCPQGGVEKLDSKVAAKAKDIVNTYLDVIFDKEFNDIPTKLRYVDALFQHVYPNHQEVALSIKQALATTEFPATGIEAQHNLTLAMQDLMHAVHQVEGKGRTKALQRACASATGAVPAFWLTPHTVKAITASKVDNLSFRLAHIALLQIEAHKAGTVNSPLATVALAASATPQKSDWQNVEQWCKYLGLNTKAQEDLIKLQADTEELNIDIASVNLNLAQAFFAKGLEGKGDLAKAHNLTRSTAKIVSHNYSLDKQRKLYASIDSGIGVRMGMRDALTGMLHNQDGVEVSDIETLQLNNLDEAIKQRSEAVFANIPLLENPTYSLLRQEHGRVHAMRDFLYQRSLLHHKTHDFITFTCQSARDKQESTLRSGVSIFAPHLSRSRQVVCQNILTAHRAFNAYMQNPHDDATAKELHEHLSNIQHIDPYTLKEASGSKAILSELIASINQDASPENLEKLGKQFDAIVPKANAIVHYAPYSGNAKDHGKISTLLMGGARAIQRKGIGFIDFANTSSRKISSLYWRMKDKLLSTESTQHVQKATCLAILKVFADTEITAGTFNLANQEVQGEIKSLLKKWGLDTNNNVIDSIVKRCLLDFSNGDGTINLKVIEKRSHALAKTALRHHEQEANNVNLIRAAFRARNQVRQENFQVATHDAFGKVLDNLSLDGGTYIYSRDHGFKVDLAAKHSIRGKKAKTDKKYLLPASVNAEVMENKAIAIMAVGTGFRVVFKNTHAAGGGASVNWKMGSSELAKGIVGLNVSGHGVEGIGVDFEDKASCLEFLELLAPGSAIHEKQTEINLQDNIFSKAKEIHYIDAEGASIGLSASFLFLGISQRLLKSTASITPGVNLVMQGGYTMSQQKNARSEVMKLTSHFTAAASASVGLSRTKDSQIHPETGVKHSVSRKKFSKSLQKGVDFTRTVEVHTKGHKLLDSTCITWEVPSHGARGIGGLPSDILKMIESNKDLGMDFYAAQAQNPQSWTVHYALKPDHFNEINRLMGLAHVTQDTKIAKEYMDKAHDLICSRNSYTPTKLTAKCVVTTAIGSNTNRGFLIFKGIRERNSMIEKPIVISLLPPETLV